MVRHRPSEPCAPETAKRAAIRADQREALRRDLRRLWTAMLVADYRAEHTEKQAVPGAGVISPDRSNPSEKGTS
jgi:hypothetical protein